MAVTNHLFLLLHLLRYALNFSDLYYIFSRPPSCNFYPEHLIRRLSCFIRPPNDLVSVALLTPPSNRHYAVTFVHQHGSSRTYFQQWKFSFSATSSIDGMSSCSPTSLEMGRIWEDIGGIRVLLTHEYQQLTRHCTLSSKRMLLPAFFLSVSQPLARPMSLPKALP